MKRISDGTWLDKPNNSVTITGFTGTDHYDQFQRHPFVLGEGESLTITPRRINWGPNGNVSHGTPRTITNDCKLRDFLAASELVAKHGGIWLRDIP